MKRNNSFMLAYIIFIFTCVVVRFSGDFPQWQILVAAITATSGIFSLADFNYTVSIELCEASKDTLKYAETAIEDIQEMLKAIDVFLDQSKNEENNELSRTEQERIDFYMQTKTKALSCLKDCEEMKYDTQKSKRIANVAEKIASTLTVVGFFLFFAIMAFEPVSKFFTNRQDVLTVLAFGTILWTQYLDETSKEKRKKIRKTSAAANAGWKDLRKSFEKGVSTHAD